MADYIASVEMHTIAAGQLCVNVLHFKGTSAVTNKFTIAKDIVDSVETGAAGANFGAEAYMIPMSTDCFLSAIVARVVGASPGPKYPRVYGTTDWPGQEADVLYSQSVACNLKLVTASGPDYTGRIFYPGIPYTALEQNRWTALWETAMNTFITDLLAGFTAASAAWTLAVYKREDHTAESVTNVMVVPNPGTIRRRLTPY